MRADYDFVRTSDSRVMVTSGGLARFAAKWPCSGMRFDADIAVEFEFANNGDLVDITWFDLSENKPDGIDIGEPEGIDGAALVALSQDAQSFRNLEREGD